MAALDATTIADLTEARDVLRACGGDLFVVSPSPPCAETSSPPGSTTWSSPPTPACPGPTARGHVVVEAAKGMIAERLGIGVGGAADVLAGYAGLAGRSVPEVAADVTDRTLDIRWIERQSASESWTVDPEVIPPRALHRGRCRRRSR